MHSLPPFPSGLPEVDLHRLPLSKILTHDPATESSLFSICQSHGFFYVDLTESPQGASLLSSADHMRRIAEPAFALPDSAKLPVSMEKTRSLFGWKAPGIVASTDKHKRSDVGQFWNVSKDDVLRNPGHVGVRYPPEIQHEIDAGAFEKFMREAHGTGVLMLSILARKLGIPDAARAMQSRHRLGRLSGDHVRLTWGPGDTEASDSTDKAGGKSDADTRITTFAHTDFGTITLLFNWLGGLQIEDAETGEWRWVRPVPGHAIVNLGDAMKVFSGRRLRSGKHRVVAAPGLQAREERYSVVYFVRPEDEVWMDDLTAGSAEGNEHGNGENGHADAGQERYQAGEWIMKQARSLGNKIPTK